MVEVGEPIVGSVEIPANSTVDVKPPAEEVWLIFFLGTMGDGTNAGRIWFHNGTYSGPHVLDPPKGIGEGNENMGIQTRARLYITENLFIKVENEDSTTRLGIYMGVRVK